MTSAVDMWNFHSNELSEDVQGEKDDTNLFLDFLGSVEAEHLTDDQLTTLLEWFLERYPDPEKKGICSNDVRSKNDQYQQIYRSEIVVKMIVALIRTSQIKRALRYFIRNIDVLPLTDKQNLFFRMISAVYGQTKIFDERFMPFLNAQNLAIYTEQKEIWNQRIVIASEIRARANRNIPSNTLQQRGISVQNEANHVVGVTKKLKESMTGTALEVGKKILGSAIPQPQNRIYNVFMEKKLPIPQTRAAWLAKLQAEGREPLMTPVPLNLFDKQDKRSALDELREDPGTVLVLFPDESGKTLLNTDSGEQVWSEVVVYGKRTKVRK